LLDRWRALPLLPLDLRGPGLILAWLLIAAWALLALSAIGLFRQAGTSLLPHRPAARLVVTGPYRYSRNPMYLALTALYLGVTLLANSIWILLLLPIVLALLQITVIRREERYLESAFGPAYREYRARVRRWL
jgi:protein-S-isoprenylcysteine O-methyltransferase Ste14